MLGPLEESGATVGAGVVCSSWCSHGERCCGERECIFSNLSPKTSRDDRLPEKKRYTNVRQTQFKRSTNVRLLREHKNRAWSFFRCSGGEKKERKKRKERRKKKRKKEKGREGGREEGRGEEKKKKRGEGKKEKKRKEEGKKEDEREREKNGRGGRGE